MNELYCVDQETAKKSAMLVYMTTDHYKIHQSFEHNRRSVVSFFLFFYTILSSSDLYSFSATQFVDLNIAFQWNELVGNKHCCCQKERTNFDATKIISMQL